MMTLLGYSEISLRIKQITVKLFDTNNNSEMGFRTMEDYRALMENFAAYSNPNNYVHVSGRSYDAIKHLRKGMIRTMSNLVIKLQKELGLNYPRPVLTNGSVPRSMINYCNYMQRKYVKKYIDLTSPSVIGKTVVGRTVVGKKPIQPVLKSEPEDYTNCAAMPAPAGWKPVRSFLTPEDYMKSSVDVAEVASACPSEAKEIYPSLSMMKNSDDDGEYQHVSRYDPDFYHPKYESRRITSRIVRRTL